MGQAFSFPQSVYTEVANQLGPDKNGMMVGLKWQSLKRTWRAITTYNSHSGCSFHATYNADVQSQAEQEAWDAFIMTDSSEGASGDFDDLNIFAWICFPPLPSVAAPVPPSNLHLSTSNTTLVSAKVSKGKTKGQTSHSKASSSAAASRWAKAALAEPAIPPALTGMTGILLHATDTMCKIKDLLVSSPTVPPTEAPITTPTSPNTPSNSIIHDASGIFMVDAALDPAI
ncbi:hypothetical protein F5141DRAFT_1065087 [Pisolithus sp. B1]|nr:hypothetical protein F5141DRAFT_1065087 [Pisolithus sp. B1]